MGHDAAIRTAFDLLFAAWGPQRWWPGDTPWEIATGAVLTQNTNWSNVEKAIAGLKAAEALGPRRTLELPPTELERLLRPSGFFRIKAVRLRAVAAWWLAQVDDADRPRWEGRDLAAFRRELLAVPGVGPETADSILLYSFHQPVFVIDAYTRRFAVRHLGLADADRLDYHDLQRRFTAALPVDVRVYNEYHALLVRLGKECCRKGGCRAGGPLDGVLPSSKIPS